MALSAFDLYSVGIGPSSSHTVGPMRAARRFVETLRSEGLFLRAGRVRVELFGSLGATGHGHGTATAVILGLEGEDPATIDTATAPRRAADVRSSAMLALAGTHVVPFNFDEDLVFHRRRSLPAHPNGMTFEAYDRDGGELCRRTYYSVGGGFVIDEERVGTDRVVLDVTEVAYPFASADELLAICARTAHSISDVMLANELAWRTSEEVRSGLLGLWQVMQACVQAGCHHSGTLPGGLEVRRRAPRLFTELSWGAGVEDPLRIMDWVNLFALAVNEENAAGGRVVTAPTNGAAGIIPAVLHYYVRFVPGADDDGVVRFLLAAAAVGMLFKQNASISGAEVGAKVRSVPLARWRQPVCARCSAAPPSRSRMPPRSGLSTTSA
jgi:L-serine dehydratase